MWVILLDSSSSMGNPFSGRTEFKGRSKSSDEAAKIDAAKKALLERLPGLGTSSIALYSFTSSCDLIYEGPADDLASIQPAIHAITPTNGTDIANALDAAHEYFANYRSQSSGPAIFRVLLVSDGLSEKGPAEDSAKRLSEDGASVDVILIDATDDGEEVARVIAVHGEVQAVVSPHELSDRVGQVAEDHAQLLRAAEEVRTTEAKVAQNRDEEDVHFTAGYPSAVLKGTWYPLVVCVHIPDLIDDVRARLRNDLLQQKFLANPQFVETPGRKGISRGSELIITPRVDGIEFNPRSLSLAWHEDIQEVLFRFRVPGTKTVDQLIGRIDISLPGLPESIAIAMLPFGTEVVGAGTSRSSTNKTATSRVLQHAFASYSSKDRPIVESIVDILQSIGVHVYLDVLSLRGRAGRPWQRELENQISKSDEFLLFWSSNSCTSGPVESEWRFAFSLMNRKGDGFIRPLRWEEPMPKPPVELRHLHFGKVDLTRFSGNTATAVPAPSQLPAAIPSVPVLPLLGGLASEDVASLESDLKDVVDFLERTTNLRYYPVPTLLVDDFAVKQARRHVAPTEELDRRQMVELTLAFAELVHLAAIEIHVGFRDVEMPDAIEREDIDARIRNTLNLRDRQYFSWRHALEWTRGWMVIHPLCDGGYLDDVEKIIGREMQRSSGENTPWRQVLRSFLSDQVPNVTTKTSLLELADVTLSYLDRALPVVQGVLGQHRFTSLSISGQTRSLMEHEIAKWGFQSESDRYSNSKSVLSGTIDSLCQMTRAVIPRLRRLLHVLLSETLYASDGNTVSPVGKLLTELVPTFGVYLDGGNGDADATLRRWAIAHGLAPELTLSGQPRVIISLDTLRRAASKLSDEGVASPSHAANMVQKLVLVHEHFHAILESGVDSARRTAMSASNRERWRMATGLNESLAVWMELELSRNDTVIREWVLEYARNGEYPSWPYAGAERIEHVFEGGGLDAVRDYVTAIRDDCLTAQQEFDAISEG
ncbi:TIR domain-containing protein [Maioricimonas sp. JC845]|uniref:TIR domain-containing protein n=1 Tax=Maioricimonas sp. JC845 TaxID=3232138 RepID=UPI003457E7D1